MQGEFCICNGSDTEFCPFHDPKILKRKGLLDQQYTGTEIADLLTATEKVLDKYPVK